MNSVERAILEGAISAQKNYQRLSGGYWLSWASEPYITTHIAEAIQKLGNEVFLEASPSRIHRAVESRPKGPKPGNAKQRFDAVVFARSSNSLNCVVEVKRAWSKGEDVVSDIKKLAAQLKLRSFPGAKGYVLVYSEAKGDKRESILEDRFTRWCEQGQGKNQKFAVRLAGAHVCTEPEGEPADGWTWGFGLIRIDAVTE